MRLALKQFFAIAKLTATDALRQSIVLLLTGSCVLFVTLLPALILHVMGDPDKLVRDSALAVQFVGGLLLAGYTACAALKHEIQRGTVATVLTKPVRRELFFVAKYAGVAAVIVLFAVATTLTTMMATRMARESYTVDWYTGLPLLLGIAVAIIGAGVLNYFTARPFPSTAFMFLVIVLILVFIGTSMVDASGRYGGFGVDVPWKTLPANALVTMALLIVAAIAVALATRLDTVATLSICSVIFLVGLMTDYLFGRVAAGNPLAAILYGLLPNWQHFWMTDALTGEGYIPWAYVGRAAMYAGCYLVGVLSWGILAFRRMELKGQA